jgi:hypothetical protein
MSLRLLRIGYGLTIWLWLIPEDDTGLVVVLAGIGSLLWGIEGWGRLHPILVGAWVGGWVAPLTVGLMFLKTVIHAHTVPEYPIEFMIGMLLRTPAWALAGALFGAAVWLWSKRE